MTNTSETFDVFDPSGNKIRLIYTPGRIEIRNSKGSTSDETFGELTTEDGQPVNDNGAGNYELVIGGTKLTLKPPQ